MATVLKAVRQAVIAHGLLPRGKPVIVAVSGGPDSLCLLHVLCQLRKEHAFDIHVAHLHHSLRGADADGDAEFVAGVARDWGLACTIERVDVGALAKTQRLSVEEAARQARYAFLADVAAQQGSETVAVGHNADDQAETVLMHLVRGAGIAGLRGMLPSSPLAEYRLVERSEASSSASNVSLVRPMLEVTRAQVIDYCQTNGLVPTFDRSNLDTTYFRNWLRHTVLPLLMEHNPNIRETIRRTARILADDYTVLRELSNEAWHRVAVTAGALDLASAGHSGHVTMVALRLDEWRALPTALQRSVLREAVSRLECSLRDISFEHVEHALRVGRLGRTGAQATLPRNLVMTVGYDELTIMPQGADPPLLDWPLLASDVAPLSVLVPGDLNLPGSAWTLEARQVPRDALPAKWRSNRDPWRVYLDGSLQGEPLCLRLRRPGDRFQPMGMGGHSVKLGDFFTNRKLPRGARDRWPILASDSGIVWVCGLRQDERARVRRETQTVLSLRFLRSS